MGIDDIVALFELAVDRRELDCRLGFRGLLGS